MGLLRVLKSWSRSTSEVVSAWAIVPPEAIVFPSGWAGKVEVDVAVGDPRERLGADRGVGALGQRRVGGVGDLHLDQCLAVVAEGDLLDRADGDAGDAHVVARDQLGGVLELGGDGVGGAAAEHEEQHHDDRAQQRENRGDPSDDA